MSAVLHAQGVSTSAVRTLARARNRQARALGGAQRRAPYVYDLLIRSTDQTRTILQLRSATAAPSCAGTAACSTMTAAGVPPLCE